MGQKVGLGTGKVTLEDPDDVDEDLLYMRLRALQSMKEKLDEEEKDEEISQMEELLQEADEAANEVQNDPDTPPPPPPLISDFDEDNLDLLMKTTLNNEELDTGEKMSSLVKRLKEAAKKTIGEKNNQEDLLNYSPTQSPMHIDYDNYSPTQSPLRDIDNHDVDLDLINPQSPKSEDEIYVDTQNTTEAAEIQFFKHQREDPLFPASVWEFQPDQVKDEAVDESNANDGNENVANFEAFHMAVLAETKTGQKFRRKRARSRGKSVSVAPSEVTSKVEKKKVEDEEDENALRAAVLTSMAEKRTKIEEEKNEQKSKTDEAKKKVIKKKIMPGKHVTLKQKKKALDLVKLKAELDKFQDKSIQNKCESFPLTKKHFPNIFCKKVVIPASDMISSSDEESGNNSNIQKVRLFKGLDLDSFMKQARSQTKIPVRGSTVISKKKPPPPKPVRKFPPKKKIVKSNGKTLVRPKLLSRTLSQADKENLKKSNISHLPLDKQKEYKRLLTLLAKKEKSKKKCPKPNILKDSTTKEVVAPPRKNTAINVDTKTHDISTSIAPQSKTSGIAAQKIQSKPNFLTTNTKNILNSGGITVSISNDITRETRDVRVNEQPAEALVTKEIELVSSRKDLCASLFKLSAEVSQLKEETKKKDKAEIAFKKFEKL